MTRVIAPILFVWAGVLLGVSFIATPAKFLAPSLPMVQALDVGRWTFHVLGFVEWGFAAVSAILLVIGWRTGRVRSSIIALIAVVVLILAAETFALRPLLDARVLQIVSGEGVPPSPWHKVYIALEALRLILILAAGICIVRLCVPDRAASVVGSTDMTRNLNPRASAPLIAGSRKGTLIREACGACRNCACVSLALGHAFQAVAAKPNSGASAAAFAFDSGITEFWSALTFIRENEGCCACIPDR